MNNNKVREILAPRGMRRCRIFITDIGYVKSLGYDIDPIYESQYLSGAGTSIDDDRGAFLSYAESLERCGNSVSLRKEVVDTYDGLNDSAVNMLAFPKCNNSETMTINRNFASDELMTWVECYDIINKEVKYIPKEHVYLFSKAKYNGEGTVNPISTGSALHDNYYDAILNGIYEVIERDGIALTWLLKHPGENITLNQNENVFDNDFLGETKLYNVSTIKGVTTLCLHAKSYHDKNSSNILMFATAKDFASAKGKIFKELVSVGYTIVNSKKFLDNYDSVDYNKFVSVDEGAKYMANEKVDKEFDFFKSAPTIDISTDDFEYKARRFNSVKEELEYVVSTLKEQGHSNIYVVDMTTRKAKDSNYKIVKVIIPSLQPLSFVHSARYIGHYRLKEYSNLIYGKYDEEKISEYPVAFA